MSNPYSLQSFKALIFTRACLLQPRPYSFNYGVKDEYSGVEYNRAETRGDQGVTRGEYTVALPDGRTQIVSYVGKWGG